MGGRIALLDTENDSASLYSDRFEFDSLNMNPPYEISKYLFAIDAAVQGGYDILIIDQISHAWAGEGGLLAKKESIDQRGGNTYTNWATITKEHEQFKAKILNANIHLICTMRSKTDYIMVVNNKGKQAPQKVGLAPIQRDGMEYEFTTVFDIAMNHEAATSKDRTNLFVDKTFKITRDTGKELIKYLSSGVKVDPEPSQNVEAVISAPNEGQPIGTPQPVAKLSAVPQQSTNTTATENNGGQLVQRDINAVGHAIRQSGWQREEAREFMDASCGKQTLLALTHHEAVYLAKIITGKTFREAMADLEKSKGISGVSPEPVSSDNQESMTQTFEDGLPMHIAASVKGEDQPQITS